MSTEFVCDECGQKFDGTRYVCCGDCVRELENRISELENGISELENKIKEKEREVK
jgi:transcription initiation factor IIE alpha subunit